MQSGGSKTGPGVSRRVHHCTAGREYKRLRKKAESIVRASTTRKQEI